MVFGSAVADFSQWTSTSVDGVNNSGGTLGLTLLAAGLVVAGVAGVSCEFAYKATADDMNFPAQACVLYAHGAVFNFAVFLAGEWYAAYTGALSASAPRFPQSLIHGFDLWLWAAVVNIALTGFLVGLIFKYIDTVAQVFSDVAAMFLSSLLSWLFFGLDINPLFLLSVALCSASVAIYYRACGPCAPDSEGADSSTTAAQSSAYSAVPLDEGTGGAADERHDDNGGDSGVELTDSQEFEAS